MKPKPGYNGKIAVIGAGVAGLTTALTLQLDGIAVVLFDRTAFPVASTSAIAGGMLAPYSESDVLPQHYIQAGLDGIELWKGLLGDHWQNCLVQQGSLVFASDRGCETAPFSDSAADLIAGIRIGRQEIERLEPAVSPAWRSALYLPEEAHLVPERTLARLFDRFIAAGGEFLVADCDPEALVDVFDHVVDCRGYIDGLTDLIPIRGELIVVHSDEVRLRRPVRLVSQSAPLYLVPRDGGEIAIGATSSRVSHIGDWRVSVASTQALLAFAVQLVPALSTARITALSSGIRAAYPSLLPELRSAAEGRITTSNGFYRHGYLLAPVTAICIAKRLKGETSPFDSLFSGRMNLRPRRPLAIESGTPL